MRAKGIAYDTGFVLRGGTSREHFDLDLVKRELAVIRDELHCTAVHLVGGDPERLEQAARCAAELGLEIWVSPYPLELTTHEVLALFADCARRAEGIRRSGAEVVFVTGVELTLMNPGFLPGDDVADRVERLIGSGDMAQRTAEASTLLNDFLRDAVARVREHFQGRITYACIPFERVDWSSFDIVSVELIRSAEVADRFQEGVRTLVAQGKPVAITGFGTATWRGAADVAPRSMEVVVNDPDTGRPVALNGDYVRDEAGQAAYLRELLEVFDAEGVDAAFVYLFALYTHPHRPDDPRRDLDLASPGIVKVLEGSPEGTRSGLPWEPKAAFAAVADHYRG